MTKTTKYALTRFVQDKQDQIGHEISVCKIVSGLFLLFCHELGTYGRFDIRIIAKMGVTVAAAPDTRV